MRVGDRVRLPPTLSQPAGEYCIVAIEGNEIRLVSKNGIERRVTKDDLPILVGRATPAVTAPVSADSFNRDDGVLSQAGYHVGSAAAMPAINRQIVLRRVFEMPAVLLPVGGDESYRAEWGEPCSERRLSKMMRCLESFISLRVDRGFQ